MLLVLAALAVAGAALSGSWLVVTVAATAGVLLGVAATRITHSELVDSRRQAARDRAGQAQAYRQLTETRTAEHAVFVTDMDGRVARRDATIGRLEHRLSDATAEVIETHERLAAEIVRAEIAEREGGRLTSRLEAAEDRAAQAIVRVAELEQELDVVTAEWHALGTAASARKHA